ncbi:MAG: hypothetical protein NC112_02650 [Oxalobacter formigenes]|nr:hypothetical protein [Oxalobacter formigenes]
MKSHFIIIAAAIAALIFCYAAVGEKDRKADADAQAHAAALARLYQVKDAGREQLEMQVLALQSAWRDLKKPVRRKPCRTK